MALLSLADAKRHLGVVDSDISIDDRILACIEIVESRVEFHMGRPFRPQTYVERYDGTGTRELILNVIPVRSLTEIKIDTTRAFADDTAIDLTEVSFTENGIVRFNDGRFWPDWADCIKVTYVAGYMALRGGLLGVFVDALRDAKHRLDAVTGGQQGLPLTAEGIGSESQSYQSQLLNWDLPDSTVRALRAYRHRV